jgi:tetratricopeptide (TPR) repeat protein
MPTGRLLRVAFLVAFVALAAGGAVVRAERPSTDFSPEAQARFRQGEALYNDGKYQPALDALKEAVRLGMADYPQLLLLRADATSKLNDNRSAIAEFTKVIDEGIEKSCRG